MVNAGPTKRRHYIVRDEDISNRTDFPWVNRYGLFANVRVMRDMKATFVEERDDEWHFSEHEKSKINSKLSALNERLSGASKRWQNNR